MTINGFGGHSCEETARSANMELLHRKSGSQNLTGQQYFVFYVWFCLGVLCTLVFYINDRQWPIN